MPITNKKSTKIAFSSNLMKPQSKIKAPKFMNLKSKKSTLKIASITCKEILENLRPFEPGSLKITKR
jgi:hypothetical protein